MARNRLNGEGWSEHYYSVFKIDALIKPPFSIRVIDGIYSDDDTACFSAGEVYIVLHKLPIKVVVATVKGSSNNFHKPKLKIPLNYHGTFYRVVDVETARQARTLREMLLDFTLPQEVCLANPLQHGQNFLGKIQQQKDCTLTLSSQTSDDYFLGKSPDGKLAFMFSLESNLQFYVKKTSSDVLKNLQFNMKDLKPDIFVCDAGNPLAQCGPIKEFVFRALPMPPAIIRPTSKIPPPVAKKPAGKTYGLSISPMLPMNKPSLQQTGNGRIYDDPGTTTSPPLQSPSKSWVRHPLKNVNQVHKLDQYESPNEDVAYNQKIDNITNTGGNTDEERWEECDTNDITEWTTNYKNHSFSVIPNLPPKMVSKKYGLATSPTPPTIKPSLKQIGNARVFQEPGTTVYPPLQSPHKSWLRDPPENVNQVYKVDQYESPDEDDDYNQKIDSITDAAMASKQRMDDESSDDSQLSDYETIDSDLSDYEQIEQPTPISSKSSISKRRVFSRTTFDIEKKLRKLKLKRKKHESDFADDELTEDPYREQHFENKSTKPKKMGFRCQRQRNDPLPMPLESGPSSKHRSTLLRTPPDLLCMRFQVPSNQTSSCSNIGDDSVLFYSEPVGNSRNSYGSSSSGSQASLSSDYLTPKLPAPTKWSNLETKDPQRPVGMVSPSTPAVNKEFPRDLCKLSVEGVTQALRKLNIPDVVVDRFREAQIDGDIFVCLDDKMLDDLTVRALDKLKILKFKNGWRPNCDRYSKKTL